MEIMATFDESLVPMEERSAEFAPVLSAVIDPLTQACSISATPLKAPDMAVYLMNCLSVVQVHRSPTLAFILNIQLTFDIFIRALFLHMTLRRIVWRLWDYTLNHIWIHLYKRK